MVSFPNLYADISGIPWLFGGTAWAGTRYYKRESVYISDFFYWNPSGVGAGIEDINLGKNLRLSYAAFAVDGRLTPPPQAAAPPLAPLTDFGLRNDLQLRGVKLWKGAELQFGVQVIVNYSNNPSTSSGWGGTFRYVQKMLGGDNKFVVQYGRGAGTGFGTLARYYYPDFSLYNAPSELRVRVVDVFTIQPTAWFGAQLAGVIQHDDLGNAGQITDWYSAGGRRERRARRELQDARRGRLRPGDQEQRLSPAISDQVHRRPHDLVGQGIVDAPGAAPLLDVRSVERGRADRHRRFGDALHQQHLLEPPRRSACRPRPGGSVGRAEPSEG